MNRQPHRWGSAWAVIALALGIVAGCGPTYVDDGLYYDEGPGRGTDREVVRTMSELNSVDAALELVQIAEAPEGYEGSVLDWLAELRDGIDGDVMFPRWDSRRKGANRFEVTYTHTVIDFDYNIFKTGYRWDVDTMLKIVDGPEHILPEDLEPPQRPAPVLEPVELLSDDFTLE